MKKQKILLLLLFLSSIWHVASGQKNTVAAGGDASGSGGNLSYSIGQIDYKTDSGSGGIATLGNQQPYEVINITGTEEKTISLFYAVFPNPTSGDLTLAVTDWKERTLHYTVLTIDGKTLVDGDVTQEKSVIDLSSYAKGAYFVNVLGEGTLVKSFKILKN